MADSTDRHTIEIDAVDHAKEAIDSVKEHLMGIAETASAITLGQLGFEGIERTVDTIKELAHGLVEANAAAETLTQTFAAIYGSGAAAKQAVDWITQFALNAPFTRSSIMEAGVAIAAIGGNITEVLPALGNLASVMNVDMPTAAQALQDAFEGRFAMMQMDLNVTKQQLESFGLQVSNTGQIVTSTLIPAFEKFVAAKYPNGMALQMQTFNGQMSNLEDQWQNIERVMGKGLFTVVKGDLANLIGFISSHQAEVNAFAQSIGEGIGHAAQAAGDALRGLLAIMPEIINGISMAWHIYRQVVEAEAGVINMAVQGIADFLRTNVAPAIYEALGTILLWWQQHGADVVKVLTDLWTNIKHFGEIVLPILTDMWGVIKSVVEFTWGAIEVIIGTALSNVDGNTKRWQSMQLDGWTKMQAGVIDAVEAMMKGVMDLATGTALPDALLGIAQMLGNLVVGVFNLIPEGIGAALNAGEAIINQFSAKMASMKVTIPGGPFGQDITIAPFANTPQFTEDFLKDAQANGAATSKIVSDFLAAPKHTPKELADAQAAQAARDKSLDDAAQSLKDDMMRSSGYVQKAVGLKNSAGGDQPGTVMWVRAGTDTTAPDFQYNKATAQQTGQDAVNAALAAWTAALNKPGAFTAGPGDKLTQKSLTDLLGDTTGAQTSGQDAKAAADAAKAAAQKAETQAREKFAWDIGHDASMATLQEDIVSILGDMKKLGATHLDIATEQWNDGKQIDAHTQQLQSAITSAASQKVAQDNEIFQNLMKESGTTRSALQGELRTILADMTKAGATDADKQSAILGANLEITSYLDKGVQAAKDANDKALANAETRFGLDFKRGADTATLGRDQTALLAALRADGVEGLQYQSKAYDIGQQLRDRLDAIDKTGKAAAAAKIDFDLTQAEQRLKLDQINKAPTNRLQSDVTAILNLTGRAATKDHPYTTLDRQVDAATYDQMLHPTGSRKDPVSDLIVGFQNAVVQGNKDAAVQQLGVVLAAMARDPNSYTANQIEAQRLSGTASITAIQTRLDKAATTQESAEVKRARMVFATDMLLGHAGAAKTDRDALLALMRKNHEESSQIGYDAADTLKQINALQASLDKKATDAVTSAQGQRLTRDQEQFQLALGHNNLPLADSLSKRIAVDMGGVKGADPYAIQLQQLTAQQQIAAATLRNENAQTSQQQKAADQIAYAFSTAMMKGDMGAAQADLRKYLASLAGIDTPAQIANIAQRDQGQINDFIKNQGKLSTDAANAIKQSALDTAKERLANDVADKVKQPILLGEVANILNLMKTIPGTTQENLRTERRHDLDLINGKVAAHVAAMTPGAHGADLFNPTASASFGSTQVTLASLYTTSSNERIRQLEAANALLRQELAARDRELKLGERQVALLEEVAEHGAQGNTHTAKIARAANQHKTSPSASLRDGGTTLTSW